MDRVSRGLTPLQERILEVLAALPSPGTLAGGGALVGFHLQHRRTRDLDLFWRNRASLDRLPAEVTAALQAAGLSSETLQSGTTFHRLRVASADETCVVDLVAEPASPIVPPLSLHLGDVIVSVDDPHEILVSKLCALLGRGEMRDLVDVKALLEAGGELERALRDAPKQDAGFSALTLAWVLKQMDVATLARAQGGEPRNVRELDGFRQDLIRRLLASSAPA